MSSGLRKNAPGLVAPAMRVVGRLKRKGVRYWITALTVFVLAVLGSPIAYSGLHLEEYRSRYFQWLLDHGPRAPRPSFVGLVLVDDDNYWGRRFAGRAPIKRDALAEIILAIPKHVRVIALDFDMRLPDPSSMEIPDEYKKESCVLIEAIESVAREGRRVVLSAPISFNAQRRFQRDTDIYQANGLCTPPGQQSQANACNIVWRSDAKSRISCGYIALPDDMLVIPHTLTLADDTPLDSFAIALARAHIPERVAEVIDVANGAVRYGSFISEQRFIGAGLRVTADQLLKATPSDPKLPDQSETPTLSRNVVIIGGNWRSFAKGRGPWIDDHGTPIGFMPGPILHANFAEAILDSRVFPALPRWLLETIEIGFAMVAAGVFALSRGVAAKVGWLAGMLAVLLFFQWLLVHAVGVFFDAFLPILGLGLHSICERLIGHQKGEPPSRRGRPVASSAGA